MCPKTRKILTLTLIRDSSRILLGLKKKGFGQGKWNGFGGKVESGETIEDAAKRELKEESSLTANELIKVGIIGFEFEGETEMMEVHIFTATEFTGEPKESEEMKPRWFNLDAIPFDEMWADDRIWFPLLLKGSCFFGFFKFRGHDTIINYTLREMDQTSFRKL